MKIQISLAILIIFSLFPPIVNAQDHYTDSLLNVLPSLDRNEKAEGYLTLAKHNLQIKPELAKDMGLKSLELFQDLNDLKGMYDATKYIGYACMYMSEYAKALDYYFTNLEYATELGEDKLIVGSWYMIGQAYDFREEYFEALSYYQKVVDTIKDLNDVKTVAKSYYGMGNIFLNTSRYEEAMKYYQEGLKLTEGIEEYDDMTNSLYNGIGNIFYEWGDYEVALDFYRKARDLNIKIGNNYSLAHSYNNIGRVYYQWEAYEEALKYYKSADSIFSLMGHTTGRSFSVYNIGLIFEKTGRREKALDNYRRYLAITQSIGSKKGIAETYGAISEFYLNAGIYDSAIFYAELMLPYAREIDHQEAIMNSYVFASEAYARMGNYRKSLELYRESIELKDKYFSSGVDEKINLIAMTFEHEKATEARVVELRKQNEIKESRIRQSRVLMIVMGGFILLLIATGILLFRNYRLLHIQKQLLLEQRLLRSQMNPHFIFNALASIQGFMFKKDIQKAGRYLSNFSKLIRNILENSREDNVTLENEIGTVTNYLELQKLRYGDKFDFKVDIDENLDPEEILVPPMLAQPFIENAVEHGIKYKEGQGHIKVRFSKNGENVVFEVEDDGVGRQKAKEIAISKGKKHKSLATKITNERIQSLSKKLRRKININIIDLKDDENNPTGTRVVFELPIIF